MEVCIVGGGIIGLATAWYLRQTGHSVCVVESRDAVGLGASRANGGQLSYRYIAPLADPALFSGFPHWLFGRDAAVRLRPRLDRAQWRWLLAFLGACNHRDRAASIAALAQLARYSRQLVGGLAADPRFDFGWRRNGKLIVYRERRAFESARRGLAPAATDDAPQCVLDVPACCRLEPALARVASQLIGGIFTPDEEVGDCLALCRAFERSLRAGESPARILLSERAQSIELSRGRFRSVRTDRRRIEADACVIANGVLATGLLRPLGIDLPLYPLKGYSISPKVVRDEGVPTVSVTDQYRRMVYARVGDRLRVAGMADIVGYDESAHAGRIAALTRETEAWFGAAVDLSDLQPWAGLRPATPDGKPIIGASGIEGLWLNVGHGALGFTLAAGSGGLLAAQLAGSDLPLPDSVFAIRQAAPASARGAAGARDLRRCRSAEAGNR
ncbi:MAG: D-amino acid dehydrogenase [Rhodocyclaceae bacterium]|nr:D-amino acid dehydrogenase [Rhodocyclaceae bacterium]